MPLLSNPIWPDVPFQAPNTEFKDIMERVPDDRNLKTPYQIYKEFITDKMLHDVVTKTNINSHHKTTKKEIETFIALYLRTALCRLTVFMVIEKIVTNMNQSLTTWGMIISRRLHP